MLVFWMVSGVCGCGCGWLLLRGPGFAARPYTETSVRAAGPVAWPLWVSVLSVGAEVCSMHIPCLSALFACCVMLFGQAPHVLPLTLNVEASDSAYPHV